MIKKKSNIILQSKYFFIKENLQFVNKQRIIMNKDNVTRLQVRLSTRMLL